MVESRGVEGALRQLLTKAHKPKPVYDCKACGACCAGFFVGPAGVVRVPLCERDVERLPWGFRKHLVKYVEGEIMIKAVKRRGSWRCPAMRGTVGRSTRCTIYIDRPRNCRYFEPNEAMCRMARFEYGLPLKPRPTLAETKLISEDLAMEEKDDDGSGQGRRQASKGTAAHERRLRVRAGRAAHRSRKP